VAIKVKRQEGADIDITNCVFKVIDTAIVSPANATTVRAVAPAAVSAAGGMLGFEAFCALAECYLLFP
jgi:hypothetical protein